LGGNSSQFSLCADALFMHRNAPNKQFSDTFFKNDQRKQQEAQKCANSWIFGVLGMESPNMSHLKGQLN